LIFSIQALIVVFNIFYIITLVIVFIKNIIFIKKCVQLFIVCSN